MQENSRQPRESGAGQPVGEACNCAGVGDSNELAWICYDCANCLCKQDKYIEMPKYALANLLFLGRLPALLQKHDTLGLRMLLCLGRPCFRKLLLGRGAKEERESGLLGNHVLLRGNISAIAQLVNDCRTLHLVFGDSEALPRRGGASPARDRDRTCGHRWECFCLGARERDRGRRRGLNKSRNRQNVRPCLW